MGYRENVEGSGGRLIWGGPSGSCAVVRRLAESSGGGPWYGALQKTVASLPASSLQKNVAATRGPRAVCSAVMSARLLRGSNDTKLCCQHSSSPVSTFFHLRQVRPPDEKYCLLAHGLRVTPYHPVTSNHSPITIHLFFGSFAASLCCGIGIHIASFAALRRCGTTFQNPPPRACLRPFPGKGPEGHCDVCVPRTASHCEAN